MATRFTSGQLLPARLSTQKTDDDVLHAEVLPVFELINANDDSVTEGGLAICERLDNLAVGDSFMAGGGAAPLVRYTGVSEGALSNSLPESIEHHEFISMLWGYLKRDPEHADRRQTGWGTKTKTGLIACLNRIASEGQQCSNIRRTHDVVIRQCRLNAGHSGTHAYPVSEDL